MPDNTQKKCFTQTHGSLPIDLPLRGPNFVSLTFTVPPQSSLWVFSDGQNTRKSVRHFSFAVVVCSALLLVFVHSTHTLAIAMGCDIENVRCGCVGARTEKHKRDGKKFL